MKSEQLETMNVALPEGLKEFVLEQVAAQGYASVSEYIRSLIRGAQREAAERELERLLLAGVASGEPIPWGSAELERLQKRAQRRQATNKQAP